jgi:hypothetical protein
MYRALTDSPAKRTVRLSAERTPRRHPTLPRHDWRKEECTVETQPTIKQTAAVLLLIPERTVGKPRLLQEREMNNFRLVSFLFPDSRKGF